MPRSSEKLYDRDAHGERHLVGLRSHEWFQLGYRATWYKPEDCFSLTPKLWHLIDTTPDAILEVVDHVGKKPEKQRAYRCAAAALAPYARMAAILNGAMSRVRLARSLFDVYDHAGTLVQAGAR